MAYKDFDDLSSQNIAADAPMTMSANGEVINLPEASFVTDADMQRDGMDLVLNGPDGAIVIEGYFMADPAPNLVAPNGQTLTPQLVDSFVHSSMQYADAGSMNDASPVGSIQELTGDATVTRVDGTIETVQLGTPIYQGDVVATGPDGAVNIVFADETSFAVSEDARLAIDEYVYDPATESGTTSFSVLKGLFVFTSGLIGRDDPDDVNIETPVGSIGIRGTIIMGDVNAGEITVVEGAIVLRGFDGKEVTLANQFETAKFSPSGGEIQMMGQLAAADMMSKFSSMSDVSGALFSSIADVANENAGEGEGQAEAAQDGQDDAGDDAAEAEGGEAEASAAEAQQPAGEPAAQDPALGSDGFGDDSGLNAEPPPAEAPPAPAPGNRAPAPADAPADQPRAAAPPPADLPPPEVVNDGDDADAGAAPPPPSPFTVAPGVQSIEESGIPGEYFSATEGTTFKVNLAHMFFDTEIPNGDVMSFQLDTPSLNYLNELATKGYIDTTQTNVDLATGLITQPFMQIQFNNVDFGSLSALSTNNFTGFDISAVDLGGNVSPTSFTTTFNVLELDRTGTPLAASEVTKASSSINLSFGSLHVFASDSFDLIDLDTNADTSFIYAGDGADKITVQAGAIDNILMADLGDDYFGIEDIQNEFYGMDGDDTFDISDSIDLTATLPGGAVGIINGGKGNDTITFGSIGGPKLFDFSAFNPQIQFNNIEHLNFANTADDDIRLDFDDIFEMTDGNNHLKITLNDADALQISGTTETAATAITTGTTITLTDVDSTNQVTLLIDAQGTNTATFVA